MPDTLDVVFAYDDQDPTDALASVADALEAGDKEYRVRGPRERFGVMELSVSLAGNQPAMTTTLEAVPADDEYAVTPAVPAVVLTTGVDEFEVGDRERRVSAFIDLVVGVYGATDPPPRLVYGLDPFQAAGVGGELPLPATAVDLREGRLSDVAWLLVVSPQFAERFETPIRRGAPVWRTRRLADGGSLLVAVADPTDPNGVDYADLRRHLTGDPERRE